VTKITWEGLIAGRRLRDDPFASRVHSSIRQYSPVRSDRSRLPFPAGSIWPQAVATVTVVARQNSIRAAFRPHPKLETVFPTPTDGLGAAGGRRLTLNLTPESIDQAGTSPGTEERPEEERNLRPRDRIDHRQAVVPEADRSCGEAQVSHLPVIVDPSHAAGVRVLVPVLARAAAVVGADGVLVEVRPAPDQAMSDGMQLLDFQQFGDMMQDLRCYVPISTPSCALRAEMLAVRGGE
jgi:hypothetical protein